MTVFFSRGEMMKYNEIISRLYSTDDCEKALYDFLKDLKSLVFFEKGDIYFYKVEDGSKLYDYYISIGYGKELDLYEEYFSPIDDALPLISVHHPVMFRSSDIFLMSERKKTAYYKNHLDPARMHYSIEGNIYVETDGYVVGLGLHRSNEHEDFSYRDLDIMKMARPHLQHVAKQICDAKNSIRVEAPVLYDFSDFDEVAFWTWDWDGHMIRSSYGENEFIKEHENDLKDIIRSICSNLKLSIQSSPDDPRYSMKSKVQLEDKTYYVNVSFKADGSSEDGIFTAMAYDYMYMIDGILNEMKDEYSFTDREFDVLKCMVQGMSNQEIMDNMYISMPTVKKHLTNIYKKLGIEGRHQLIHSIL